MKKRLSNDEKAWADYLITRVGLFIFCSVLLLSSFKIQPLFIKHDAAGMLDAQLSYLALFIEEVDGTSIPGAYYYEGISPNYGPIGISSRYLCADVDTKTGRITRAQALMTTVYPSNSKWNNRSELIMAIASMCQDRTGIGNNTLQADDWDRIYKMLRLIEGERADVPFIPDTNQPLIVERVLLNFQSPEGIQRRGMTIVYQ